jgi:uncharacterized protein (DUF2236 family)
MPGRRRLAGQPGPEGLDAGLFGPGSESWRVLRERSVVMGGMRALLMHAAHPLIAAAAAQTGMYEHDPWRRHERTLRLTFTLVFGTRQEAAAAARQINAAHRPVHGRDSVTGLAYHARNPELLLWVHASLVSSFLLFERLTVGALDAAGRQRFHEEAAIMAALLGLPASRIPPRVSDLDPYIEATIASGILRLTRNSHLVAALMRRQGRGAAAARSRAASFLAFHTLPPQLRDLYGIDHGRTDQLQLEALCTTVRLARRAVPVSARWIGPAIAAAARMRGEPARISETAVLAQWRETDRDAAQPL